jgi:dTDP-4-dehydrorhamnose 3,5-epimerase
MPFQEMKIKGAWIHTPIRHIDQRGYFEEQFKLSQIESELGRSFTVRQVNKSLSKRGALRGIHYSDTGFGEAKYVSCTSGAVWDVVVDLRVDSPTYRRWDAIEISAENNKSVLISEGLGHAFLALTEFAEVVYLVSQEYSPVNEKVVFALDEKLAIPFEEKSFPAPLILSQRDAESQSLGD